MNHEGIEAVTWTREGGGHVGNSFYQNAPILMQKHFLESVIVLDSSK